LVDDIGAGPTALRALVDAKHRPHAVERTSSCHPIVAQP